MPCSEAADHVENGAPIGDPLKAVNKIALAIENFSTRAGGAESYAVALAEALSEAGWQVHLIGLSWEGLPAGAVFHRLRIPAFLPPSLQMLLFALRHRRLVAESDFDVVLGFGNTITMNVYQSHGGVHWVSTARKVYSEPSALRRAIKRLLIRLTPKQWVRHYIESAAFRIRPRPKIVAISDMVSEDMQKAYGVAPEAIRVIYNGVDTARYAPDRQGRLRGPIRRRLGIAEDETVFLLVSYDLKKKGIGPLVEAAGCLHRRHPGRFRVLVVGGTPSAAVQRRIRALDLGAVLFFEGKTASAEGYFASADAFVLPTFYDACSLVVFEAMACGLPVITTTANGAAGILTDGAEGYVVGHPPRPETLAEKMERMLDPAVRTAMGEAARETARAYTIENNHREMIRVLAAAAAAGGKEEHEHHAAGPT